MPDELFWEVTTQHINMLLHSNYKISEIRAMPEEWIIKMALWWNAVAK